MSRRNRKAGFTLAEILIALAIMAGLLTSVAAVVHASMLSYKENDTLTAITQNARSILHRMMREIRTAEAVTTGFSKVTIIPPHDGSGIQQIEYEFDEDLVFSYRQTIGGHTTSHVLLDKHTDEVSLTYLVIQSETETVDGITYTKTVTVTMKLRSGNQDITIRASASPRRNQSY